MKIQVSKLLIQKAIGQNNCNTIFFPSQNAIMEWLNSDVVIRGTNKYITPGTYTYNKKTMCM